MTCDICGRWGALEAHHIFEGRNRKVSDRYGAVVHICRACHNDIHQHPSKYSYLKREWQRKLMAENNWSIEDWLSIFRRNYE